MCCSSSSDSRPTAWSPRRMPRWRTPAASRARRPETDRLRRHAMTDALAELNAQGVSVWLDDISRERLRSGNLQELVDTKHIVGVTSNPTIFQKALDKGDAYDEQLHDLRT